MMGNMEGYRMEEKSKHRRVRERKREKRNKVGEENYLHEEIVQ